MTTPAYARKLAYEAAGYTTDVTPRPINIREVRVNRRVRNSGIPDTYYRRNARYCYYWAQSTRRRAAWIARVGLSHPYAYSMA